jgi:CHAT domain-containing protein
LAVCDDCAARYQRIAKPSYFFFRPIVVASAVSVLVVATGVTFLSRHAFESNQVVYRSAPTLGLSVPEDNASIAIWETFRWQPVASASAYQLTVYDSQTGTIVLQRSMVTPLYVLQPNDAALMAAGRTYTWEVKADSPGTGPVTSSKRRFHLAPGRMPQSNLEPPYKDFSADRRKEIVVRVRKGDAAVRQSTLDELQFYVSQHPSGTTADRAWALSEMAVIYYYLEDRQRSEDSYRNSLAGWQTLANYPFMYAKTLSNYGLALQDNGKLGQARQAYLEAATILRTQNSDQSNVVLSNTLLNLGTLLRRMGLYNEALSALIETLDLDRESDRPDKTIAVAQDLTDIGNLYADLRDLPQALAYLKRAHDDFEGEVELRKKQHRPLADMCEVNQAFADTLGSLGDAYTARGEIPEAIEWYSKTRVLDEECHSEPHQAAQTLNNLGELYLRHLQQPESARPYYQRALALVDKRSVDEAWRTYYGLGLIALRTGQDAEAESWLEKSISAVQTVGSSTADPESLRHVWSSRTSPFYLLALFKAQRDSALGTLEAMERGRHRAWLENGLNEIRSPSFQWKPDDSPPGTVELEYFVGEPDDPVLLVVSGGGDIHAYQLSSGRTVEQLISAATAALASSSDMGQPSSQLQRLAHELLPPSILSGLRSGYVNRIVVSLDGALTQFPFSALAIGEEGRPYLFERADVTTVPSLGWWFQNRQQTSSWTGSDALVVANPVVDETNGCTVPANLVADLHATTQTFPRLSFTTREAAAVTRFAGHNSVVLSSERANMAAFANANPANFKILHFATHAHAGDDLWSSFISLGCRGQLDALVGRQLASLNLKQQLVVLSACGGSAGKSLSAMGSDSIASGFLMAGAGAVVASHWRAEDDSTAQLMNGFYRELANGAKVDHALRLAQLQLLRTAPRSFNSWAAFEVSGNGNLIVPISPSWEVRTSEFFRCRRGMLAGATVTLLFFGLAGWNRLKNKIAASRTFVDEHGASR